MPEPRYQKFEPYDEVVAERLAEVPAGPKPLDVPCPFCGAEIGVQCSARSGYGAATHAPRWRAVGVARPSHDDRLRDYWDGERRKLEAIKARPVPLWWAQRKEN